MNPDIVRRYRKLRKLGIDAKQAHKAATTQHAQQIIADVLGVPTVQEMRRWDLDVVRPVELCLFGWIIQITVPDNYDVPRDELLSGKIRTSASAYERRSQEVFSLSDQIGRDGYHYFEPDESEAEIRAHYEKSKVGKAKAIRCAREQRQSLVEQAQEYLNEGYCESELVIDFGDHAGHEYVLYSADDPISTFEELRALLSSTPSRNHC
jgi:hypothetical protein